MKKLIEIKNLVKEYDHKTFALNGISFDIEKGSWTSILGASGSGKSTLLNMIGCLDKPSSGQVLIDDLDVSKLSSAELASFRRDNIGFVFQQQYVISYLSALENVMLAQYYHSIVDEQQAKEALERVGLGHRLDHRPSQLSGGEQQRVCIARALINEPRIILADEPTGNLDKKNSENIYNFLKELHDEGHHTIILITHDEEAAGIGDRTIRLADGNIACFA